MKAVYFCVALLLAVSLPSAFSEEEAAVEKPKFFFYNSVSGAVSWTDPRPLKHIDDEGRIYYSDPADGEKTWWENDVEHMPQEYAWVVSTVPIGQEHAGKPYFFNKVTQESEWDTPLSMAWKKMHSDRIFYYNSLTGTSQHERPEDMGHHDEKSGRTYWIDAKTGEATWESEHWWTEVTISEEESAEYQGNTYWVQEMTQEVSLTKPEAMSWVEWHEEAVEVEKEL